LLEFAELALKIADQRLGVGLLGERAVLVSACRVITQGVIVFIVFGDLVESELDLFKLAFLFFALRLQAGHAVVVVAVDVEDSLEFAE